MNNILTVLNVALDKAVEWGVIPAMPCAIKLLPAPKATGQFYEFDGCEALVAATRTLQPRTGRTHAADVANPGGQVIETVRKAW